MLLVRSLIASALLLSLSACAATVEPRSHVIREGEAGPVASDTTAPATAPRATAPVSSDNPPNDNLNAVAWMQTSVEFRLVSGQTFRSALVQLDKAIKTPAWDALPASERENPATGLAPAIIVDVIMRTFES